VADQPERSFNIGAMDTKGIETRLDTIAQLLRDVLVALRNLAPHPVTPQPFTAQK
jgi:hypothetical protein